jgi:ABC-2 type transport system permease protein
MQAAPSTHYTGFAQAVLYRDAGLDVVWPQVVAMVAIGSVFFALALKRFRATMAMAV